VQRGEIDVHADAGPQHVDGDQADDQRDGGDDLEVDEGLDRDASYLAQIAHAGDPCVTVQKMINPTTI
jgi:hypothetical protein